VLLKQKNKKRCFLFSEFLFAGLFLAAEKAYTYMHHLIVDLYLFADFGRHCSTIQHRPGANHRSRQRKKDEGREASTSDESKGALLRVVVDVVFKNDTSGATKLLSAFASPYLRLHVTDPQHSDPQHGDATPW
jgi:hypothetical protein